MNQKIVLPIAISFSSSRFKTALIFLTSFIFAVVPFIMFFNWKVSDWPMMLLGLSAINRGVVSNLKYEFKIPFQLIEILIDG